MYGNLAPYDVFNASLLTGADYEGPLELPVIMPSRLIPESLTPFTRARAQKTGLENSCIHFFEHDVKFRCVWRNPMRYLPLFRRCRAVIGPDFSMYRNMPAGMQQWSCFKSRTISYWLQHEGVEVIPNVRVSDERSLDWVFDGLPRNSVIAMSTVGCCKHRDDRRYIRLAVEKTVDVLRPSTIIVYGAAPDGLFIAAHKAGVPIKHFDSQFALSHKRGQEVRNGDR
ncbi:DUF4417 domain-containing protein [Coriobacteriaceae bacterium]|uniref:DUF4417 domain-containing protein n=1 Tax=Granulimonas faecalis TaxID=2894155 RepID=A0AAV5AYP9_9ACTN|nr:DUF4417 domain-containing protein [Granulimonas faecalis]TGY59481.1 DUF4417 domain-containing protein [Coriobacteriaceae bacterium]GJM54740.1 hypothetical protein ATOP_03950 [Granulimonas faecalis]